MYAFLFPVVYPTRRWLKSCITPNNHFQVEGVEWTTALLRCWLTLEVVAGDKKDGDDDDGTGDGKLQQQQQQQQPQPGEWFILARLQGTLVNPPRDGVERRFTSAFSKIALRLDPHAFPEVQAVEVNDVT